MGLFDLGWQMFDHDPALLEWVRAVRGPAGNIAADPEHRRNWLRCGGTWFVGVNLLPNDARGAVGDSSPLTGQAFDFILENLTEDPPNWDRGQVSVCYQGYPQPWDGESEAAFRFRRNRDAAHVDGLLRVGPDARRHLREFHRFLLGIPLYDVPDAAAPFVIWEGSHKLVAQAFAEAFAGHPPEAWTDIDVTEMYQALRRRIFAECPRRELPAKPGQAYIIHRHALHGMAPWDATLEGPIEGRSIIYFRPEDGMSASDWLNAP